MKERLRKMKKAQALKTLSQIEKRKREEYRDQQDILNEAARIHKKIKRIESKATSSGPDVISQVLQSANDGKLSEFFNTTVSALVPSTSRRSKHVKRPSRPAPAPVSQAPMVDLQAAEQLRVQAAEEAAKAESWRARTSFLENHFKKVLEEQARVGNAQAASYLQNFLQQPPQQLQHHPQPTPMNTQ